MDNIRIVLWLLLATLVWFGFNQWTADYGPPPRPETTETVTPSGSVQPTDAALPDIGSAAAQANLPEFAESTPAMTIAEPIHVQTDVLDLIIDANGGDIVRVDLPGYPVHKDTPELKVRLLDYEPPTLWEFEAGVLQPDTRSGPTHLEHYTARASSYTLAAGQDELIVTLDWANEEGLSAHKTYTFRRGQYEIDLDMQVQNDTGADWRGVPYVQMLRRHVPVKRTYLSVDSYSFTGPVLYNGDSYEKLQFDDLQKQPLTAQYTNGWLASIQHHFLAAAVPPADEQYTFEATTIDDQYRLRAVGSVVSVPARSARNFGLRLFVGPKLQDQLEAAAQGLELTVDYGRLTMLAHPLFLVLRKVHEYIGNWGWSIIIVTFLIKLVFYKLTATSGRSMAKMRKIAPRMKALQERFKDDRQGLSAAMMELYKKEKVNPAAGCLPIVIQMPFFFSFYWVLIESVEMRQAPFMLWINDLSSRDPFFILPLLMAGAMFFQSRLNPAPPDPVQARIMQIMPLAFSVMFAFFPAGLVLYWLTNTVLSIAQQWRINKLVAAEA
jgi:YidC/Oxa1 family membrane protein insertase